MLQIDFSSVTMESFSLKKILLSDSKFFLEKYGLKTFQNNFPFFTFRLPAFRKYSFFSFLFRFTSRFRCFLQACKSVVQPDLFARRLSLVFFHDSLVQISCHMRLLISLNNSSFSSRSYLSRTFSKAEERAAKSPLWLEDIEWLNSSRKLSSENVL